VPIDNLINKNYIKKRLKDFTWDKANSSENIKAGTFEPHESEETTHYSIIDESGNALSVTTTLNGSYGSKVVVEGAGFLLNNEMDDFSIKPGQPNLYGVIGGEANAIQAHKRMLSSMTPTIIEEKGRLRMLVGTPGGSTIPTSVLQVILNVLEFGLSPQEAVKAPRFHHQWTPDIIYTEENPLMDKAQPILAKKGYQIQKRSAYGRVEAILVLPEGKLQGGADSRGDDSVGGY
jgi:gamma-glutamyltranspeptidase / glutathione hydrolase